RVLELQAVDRQHFGSDLIATVRIEQLLDALARRYSSVMRAFRTHVEVLLQIGAVQGRFARRTLDPQPLGNRFLGDPRRRLDTRLKELLQPAHLRSLLALGCLSGDLIHGSSYGREPGRYALGSIEGGTALYF